MTVLVAIPPIVVSTVPFLAQSSDGVAGLLGMFGIFGFLVVLFYGVLLFFLPFIVWGCLVKLTNIRDDIRGFRKDLRELTKRTNSATPLPSMNERHQVQP
jgi:hypothetical protein